MSGHFSSHYYCCPLLKALDIRYSIEVDFREVLNGIFTAAVLELWANTLTATTTLKAIATNPFNSPLSERV
jgi:hypothetical protein